MIPVKNSENNGYGQLTKEAYDLIKSKIITGELKQGEVFSISAMAKKLNISRTPLTYACQKLEYDHFLKIAPKQGVVINTITISDAREIYELRAAIESYSAKKSFDLINSSDIQELEEIYKRQVEAVTGNDNYRFMVEDISFHKRILNAHDNAHFYSLLENLYDRAFILGLESTKSRTRLRESLKEHREIIDSLKNNDKNTFIEKIEENIINGFKNLTGGYK
jgi:DNA-binding GntR family transcriptional regulator